MGLNKPKNGGSVDTSTLANIDLANVSNANMLSKGKSAGLAANDLSNVSNANMLSKIKASGFHSSMEKVKLWENASPTSNFTAQEISIDLSGYQWVYMTVYAATNSRNWLSYSPWCEVLEIGGVAYFSTGFRNRSIAAYSNKVYIDDCYPNSTSTKENQYLIPHQIWGIKEVFAK